MYKCRICGNQSANEEFVAKEMRLGFREPFPYFQCSQCECLQIADFPSDLGRYYPGDYYSYANPEPDDPPNALSRQLRTLRLRHYVGDGSLAGSLLVKLFGEPDLPGPMGRLRVSADARILDFGCGSGRLLCRLSQKGYKHLFGADPFIPSDLHYKSGVEIMKVDASGVVGEFDFIMLNHSFEHLPNPLEVLKLLKDRLANNGKMLLRIPTVSSFAWRHYRTDWVQLDAPRHLFLHSLKSVGILCEEAGLKIERVEYDSGDFQFWGSEQYRLDIPLEDERSLGKNPSSNLFSESKIQHFRREADRLNEQNDGDQVAITVSSTNA